MFKKIVRCRETSSGCPGRARGAPHNRPRQYNQLNLITVAAMRTNSAVVTSLLGGVSMGIIVDSGSAVSMVRKDMISPQMNNVVHIPLHLVKLVTAAGDDLLIVDHIQTTVQIQHHTITHSFIVVNALITPAILGIDFLQQHGITIDFASTPIGISVPPVVGNMVVEPCLKSVLETERTLWTKHCAVVTPLMIRWKISVFRYFSGISRM